SGDIVVNFSSAEYISSAGLRGLMAASRSKPKERRLAVACLNAIVGEIFATRQQDDRLLDRLRTQISDPRPILSVRRVVPGCGCADFRRDVLARRPDLGQGRLGSFEQRCRGRAGAGGAGQAPRAVSP